MNKKNPTRKKDEAKNGDKKLLIVSPACLSACLAAVRAGSADSADSARLAVPVTFSCLDVSFAFEDFPKKAI